jgi:hypothetical protein
MMSTSDRSTSIPRMVIKCSFPHSGDGSHRSLVARLIINTGAPYSSSSDCPTVLASRAAVDDARDFPNPSRHGLWSCRRPSKRAFLRALIQALNGGCQGVRHSM